MANDERQTFGGAPLWPMPDDSQTAWRKEFYGAMDRHMENFRDRTGSYFGGSAEWEQSEMYRELMARRPS